MTEITKQTRREAHEDIKPKKNERREHILSILNDSPMTADEVAEQLYLRGITPYIDRNFAAPRLTELNALGIVEVIGKKISERTGKKVAVFARKGKTDEN